MSEGIAPGLQQHVMLAVLRLGEDAYGVSVRDELKRVTKRSYSLGAIYVVFKKLEETGYLTKKRGESESRRGGRAKILYSVSVKGRLALAASLRSFDDLRASPEIPGVPA